MKIVPALLAVALAVVSAGCGGSSSGGSAFVRAVNTLEGPATLNFTTDGAFVAGALPFGNYVAGYTSDPVFLQTVFAADPSSGATDATTEFDPTSGLHYTLIAYGIFGNQTTPATLGVITDLPNTGVAGQGQVRFANMSAKLDETVDVYLTSPGTLLTSVAPTITGVGYGVCSGYVFIPAGTYQLQVTPTGAKTPVLMSATFTVTASTNYTSVGYDSSSSAQSAFVMTDTF